MDLYSKLREKLDGLAFGYPATETGEELELLQWFFDPEDAQMYLEMEDRFLTPEEVASKIGQDPVAVAERLELMTKKGLVFHLEDNKGINKYRIMPMVHGIFEINSDRLNLEPDVAKKFSKYYGKHMMKFWNSTDTPLFRTIPINNELTAGSVVLPYNDAEAILKSKKRIAVTNCACRGLLETLGKRRCTHPIETCLMFDETGDYYVEHERARYITLEEALEGLKRNDREGLVINVSNSQNPEIMCSCCSCCCGVTTAANYFPGPSLNNQNDYICIHNEELCIACGKCVERCVFKANEIIDEKVSFNPEKCYGCGLCVTTCPTNSRSLEKRPEDDLYEPPEALYRGYDLMKKYRQK